jgi:hypothetical protein
MKPISTFAALTLLALVSGCATTANYEKLLSTWVGSTELELIRTWGAPQNSYTAGDSKFVVYSTSRSFVMPGTNPTYTTTFIGNTAITNSYGGAAGYNISLGCQTTFEISNGQIVSWSWQGNDCKSRE